MRKVWSAPSGAAVPGTIDAVAVDVAGFDAAQADQLRRAMGSKRSTRRMEGCADDSTGMERLHRITGPTADRIYEKMAAFANFGFPEKPFAELRLAGVLFGVAGNCIIRRLCAALLRASRWASPRSRWSPTPGGRGAECTGHTSTRPCRGRHWRTRARDCGWASRRCAGWATRWQGGSSPGTRPGGDTPTSTTCPAAPNSTSASRRSGGCGR